MLGGSATTPGQMLGTPTTVQPGSAATAVTQRVGPPGVSGIPLTLTANTAVKEKYKPSLSIITCHLMIMIRLFNYSIYRLDRLD